MIAGSRKDDALERLRNGVAQLTTSDAWSAWLRMQARFHHYSFANTVLILVQQLSVHPPRSGQPGPYQSLRSAAIRSDRRRPARPLRDHIVSLERLLELLLAERSRRLTAEEIAILDLALEATYAGEWRDTGGGQVRGG
jgi:hypothetical protein